MKKWLLGGLALLVVLVGGGLWWLRGNLDHLVRRAIVEQGSTLIGAPVKLDGVHIDPASGLGELQGLTIGNPAGFKTPHLLKVQKVLVQVDIGTLTQPVITLKNIELQAPDVIYEKGERQTNIEAIQAHIVQQLGAPKPAEGGSSAPKKFIVEHFLLQQAQAQASAAFMNGKTMSLQLPPLEMRDLGKAEGGLTGAQLGQVLANAMQQRLLAGFSFDRALKAVGDTAQKAGAALGNLFKR